MIRQFYCQKHQYLQSPLKINKSASKFQQQIKQHPVHMYWCHNCSNNCSCVESCPMCNSSAVEQVNNENHPQLFTPYQLHTEKEEEFFSLESLYRNAYRELFQVARQRRPERVESVDQSGNQRVQYVFVLNATEDEQIRGLSAQQIQSLPTKIIHSQCSICQQSKPGQGFILKCNHEFHRGCLTPWIQKTATCPSCRFKLVENQ